MSSHIITAIYIIIIVFCFIYPRWATIKIATVGDSVNPIPDIPTIEYGLFRLRYQNKVTNDFSVIEDTFNQDKRTIYMIMVAIGFMFVLFSSVSKETNKEDPHLNLVLLLIGSFIGFMAAISALFGGYAGYSMSTDKTLITKIGGLTDEQQEKDIDDAQQIEDKKGNNAPVSLVAVKKPSVCLFLLLHASLFVISYSITTLSMSTNTNQFYF